MNRVGKRTRNWEQERARLKKKFEKWGIMSCELRYPGTCWGDNALGFAHAKKRRFLKPEELGIVVLCCNPCHDILESLPHEFMEVEVMQAIANRKKSLKKSLDLPESLKRLSVCARS
jgi:hypothetical protein